VEQGGIRGNVLEPDGRLVVLRDHQWDHIRFEHLDMARFERAIMETVTHPDHREADSQPDREHYFARGKGPSRWLRVVVDFSREPAEVVTAFAQDNDP
jgi:hypothetical protein